LIEWRTALASGDSAVAFLATQGDPWDTQEDMFMALIGAVCALVFVSRAQDRALSRLTGPER
jgi:putative membrane protein